MMYHFIALLFYFAAFVLEAATTSATAKDFVNGTACIHRPKSNIVTFMNFRQYSVNVVATVSYGHSLLILLIIVLYQTFL